MMPSMLAEALERPQVTRTKANPVAADRAEVVVAGRRLRPTEVFDTYWTFASRRQHIYNARLNGADGPWTDDPILREHRFTNCYRAADRVSQYLISDVIYSGSQEFDEVVFRTLLFKLFNKVETWEMLLRGLGETPSWSSFDLDAYDQLLSRSFEAGTRIYSAAYVMAPPKLGAERKHTNHLRLLRDMMTADLPDALAAAATMKDAFELLRAQPGIGDFLAFQYVIDLNYSAGLHFDEMDYGAKRQALAANRLPEPLLRGRQVLSGRSSDRRRRQRPLAHQAKVRTSGSDNHELVPAEVGYQLLPGPTPPRRHMSWSVLRWFSSTWTLDLRCLSTWA